MKTKNINELGLLIQAILLVTLLYSFILVLFMSEFKVLLNIIMGLTLFSMAYNNQVIYKKKYMTICYVIFGIFCFIMGIILWKEQYI